MDYFEHDEKDRELDELLADVHALLGETASERFDEAPEEPAAPVPVQPEAAEEVYETEVQDDLPEQQPAVRSDETIQFRPLTYYEQSKADYQVARRAEYERAREQQRLQREREALRRAQEEEASLAAMESLRGRKAPDREEDYSEWLYQQGTDPETMARREAVESMDEESFRPPRKRRRGRFFLRLAAFLVVLLLLSAAALHFLIARPPQSELPIGERRDGTATILLAGTDEGGYRTDTIMLLNLDRESGKIHLASIPRDTLIFCEYSVPKINSAYGWAKGGTKGMAELMKRVTEIIGFEPDGYLVFSLESFSDVVSLLGGVRMDVPMDMNYEDPMQKLSIHLTAGEQKLDGDQAMQLVRFRSGYADADLGRVQVQRQFLSAALKQWVSPRNLLKIPKLLRLLQTDTFTNLSVRNLLWIGESALFCDRGNIKACTLPGTAGYISGGSYYVLDPAGVANTINEGFCPYKKGVAASDLFIRAGS